MTKKIVRACFLGGCLTVILGLFIGRLIAVAGGLAVGYLAFEFGEVLRAIPTAFRNITKSLFAFGVDMKVIGKELKSGIEVFLREKHPFYYPSFIVFGLWGVSPVYERLLSARPATVKQLDECVAGLLSLGFWVVFSVGLAGLLALVAQFGAKFEKVFWVFHSDLGGTLAGSRRQSELISMGLLKLPMTYTNAYRWILKGVLQLLLYPFMLLYEIAKALLELVRIIHSNKRLLCAVDGTAGGFLVLHFRYFFGTLSPAEIAVLTFAGGALGALLGTLNWEIISKKVYGFS